MRKTGGETRARDTRTVLLSPRIMGTRRTVPVSLGGTKEPSPCLSIFCLVRLNHAFVVAAVVVHHREISCVDPYGISIAVSETRLVDEEIV